MDSQVEVEPLPDAEARQAEALVTKWVAEIAAAQKREKDFRKEGFRLVKLYEGAEKDSTPFNILFANTETLAPALYNSVPRPVVQRRFKDDDPLGLAAAKAGQRILEYLLDDGMSVYSSYDDLMRQSVLEALVPGRGVVRYKYEATIEKMELTAEGEAADPPDEDDGEAPAKPESVPEKVTYESVCGEEVPWDRFSHGYAKKWKDVPWVAFDHFMTPAELKENFGDIGAAVPCEEVSSTMSDNDDQQKRVDDADGVKGAWVHEIWDKVSKRVLFIAPNFKRAPLKLVDDPLGLEGFLPMPEPLTFVSKISNLTPVALYQLYEQQAKELNRITLRINKLIDSLKVRGMYDSQVQGLDKVLGADDATLIPAENVAAMLAQGTGLEKSIWLVPIEKIYPVLQQLFVQRQQCKQIIYEITGIADIMRGSTQASETLGAQELKNQWGTLRLKKQQKAVATFCRDSLRIMLEIAVTKLSEETLQAMTGLPYPTGSEKAQMVQVLQQAAAMGAEVPPELQAAAEGPSWAEILELLRHDLNRSYRIDVETNSTVDMEATEDKEHIAELLTAISQFLSGISPLVEQGVMPFEIARDMLLVVTRRFRLGNEFEEQLKKMQQPQPKPDPKAEADMQMQQIEMQQKQLEGRQKQRDAQLRERELMMQMEFKEKEHAIRMAELDRKAALAEQEHELKLEQLAAQVAAARAMPQKPAAQGKSGGKRPGITN